MLKTLYLKNNSRISAKVIEVNDTEIKYKLVANVDGPMYVKKKTDIVKVKYKSGLVDVFQEDNKSATVSYNTDNQRPLTTKNSEEVLTRQDYTDMFRQGKNDAKIYYKGYKGAGTGTFLTTFFLGPVVGLIPAIATSVTTPNEDHLTFPNIALTKNADYVNGYTQEAKKKKSRKVWGNFGIATGILVGAAIVVAGSAK